MKRLLIFVLFPVLCFAQGGTTASDIKPANTGQNLGADNQRWNLFAQDVDLSGNLTYQGTVITPASASNSNNWTAANTATQSWTWTNAGTFTNFQMNPTNEFLQGGLTNDNINSLQSGLFTTDTLTLGQLIPNTSTVYQANALAAYQQNNSNSTSSVVGYFQGLAGANNAKVWTLNPSAADYGYDGVDHTNVTLHGIEIDLNAKNSTTAGDALFIQGNIAGNTLGNIGAIHIPKPLAGSWGYGLIVGDQSLFTSISPAIQIGSPALSSSASYPLIFVSRSSLGVATPIRMYGDQFGAVNFPKFATSGAYDSGTSTGDGVLINAAFLYSDTAAHNANFKLIGGNASNQVSIDPGNQGTVVGGLLTANSGIKAGASGSTISDTRELAQSVHGCGSTSTCSNTANQSYREVWGTITLAAGAGTLTGISPVFTSTSSFGCTCTDQTAAAACKAVPASTSSVTFAGTGTDVLFYRCIGN